MSTDADQYMARAIQLARTGWYSCRPNPRVGCVIVQGDRIVGEGAHLRAGEAHAEVIALRAAGAEARGAICYVSLEPCAHHGRTPPCVDALVQAGVARVVFAATDPNPEVRGLGAQHLQAAGIDVQGGVLADAAEQLNAGFRMRMLQGRPRVYLKLAMSLDGKVALANGQSKWLTSDAARADVQRLRAEAGALLSGIGTVIADDPSFTVRDSSYPIPSPPLRAVLDTNLRMPTDRRLLHQQGSVIVYTGSADAGREAALAARGVTLSKMPLRDGRVSLPDVLRDLAAREINDVLVESGPTLAGALIEAGLVDELILYIAPRLLGESARSAFALPRIDDLAQTPWLQISDTRQVGLDWRLTAAIVAKP